MKRVYIVIGMLLLISCGNDDGVSFNRDFLVNNIDGEYVLFSATPDLNPDDIPSGIFNNGSILETLNCNNNSCISFNNGMYTIQSGPYNTNGITNPECTEIENDVILESGVFFVQDDNPNIGLTGSEPVYLIFLKDVTLDNNDDEFQNSKSLRFTIVGENPTNEIEFSLSYIYLAD